MLSLISDTKRCLFILIISSVISFSCNSSDCKWPEKLIENGKSLNEIVKENNYAPEQLSILICKSKNRLYIIHHNVLIKSYAVVFGSNPRDDKLKEGDGCTPEGVFHIRSKYPHKKWSRFMWLDYPNENSFKKFKQAIKNKTIPKNSNIGGQVGIHGTRVGQNFFVSMGINWTKGCISLKRQDIEDLYDVVPEGIEVTIEK